MPHEEIPLVLCKISNPVLRKMALHNHLLLSRGHSEALNIAQALRYGFDWSKTAEGYIFWHKIWNQYLMHGSLNSETFGYIFEGLISEKIEDTLTKLENLEQLWKKKNMMS